MSQSIKVWLNRWEERSVKIRNVVRQGCCLFPIVFNFYSEYLAKVAVEVFGVFKLRGQIIYTLKYVNGLMLQAK